VNEEMINEVRKYFENDFRKSMERLIEEEFVPKARILMKERAGKLAAQLLGSMMEFERDKLNMRIVLVDYFKKGE
jgi:hypothetical protein